MQENEGGIYGVVNGPIMLDIALMEEMNRSTQAA